MNVAAKLGAYGVILAAVLGGGAALGAALGPLDDEQDDIHEDEAHPADGGTHETTPPITAAAVPSDVPGGVLVSQAGYTIVARDPQLDGNSGASFEFRIVGPEGATVQDYEVRHEEELHLIVVDTDLGTFAHVHPTLGDDGTWTVELPELAPGAYRAIADFTPTGGPDLALGLDLAVAGEYVPQPRPPISSTDQVASYEVALSGAPTAGGSSEVTFTVTEDGQPVADLEPYLGSFGHLVALRAGDLAYLHVHPVEEAATGHGGPAVSFAIDVPSPGDYRLFFDFARDGQVLTADFTVTVAANGTATAPPTTTSATTVATTTPDSDGHEEHP